MRLLRRRATPRVSVVVATYDWPEALRLSVASALAQTLGEIEVIVVGDGCSDDTEQVVHSIGDRRVRWIGLAENSGDQAAPNNAGISASRAPWIAYLGHDDIWHPRHLERMLDTATTESADVGYAVAILYGPTGSGIRWLSGLTSSGQPEADAFLVPSSLLHRRDLTERIGPWGRADELDVPIDVDLQRRAWDAGMRFAGSGSVSVFKWPAGWRRDAYLERSVSEQQALLARLQREPDVVERELVEVCRAFLADRADRPLMPGPATPGEYARRNRAHKGLDAPAPRDGTAPDEAVFDPTLPMVGFEWHPPELDAAGRPFRWTGPLTRSTIVFRVRTDVALSLTMRIVAALTPELLDGLELEVNGETVLYRLEAEERGGWLAHAAVPARLASAGRPSRVAVALCLPRTIAPTRLDPASHDGRELGIAVGWARVSPAVQRPQG